jgi:RNA polymerase sigma factor (sigma-70 family)
MPYIAPEKDLSDEQIIDLFMPADEGERSAYIRNLCQEVQASCRAQRAANPQLDHALMDQTARGVVLLRKTYNHYRKIDNREPSIMADMQYALGAYVKRIEPYVHVIARQLEHANSAHTREDLVSEGQMGLLEALGRFDLGWETRFISYASRRIHGAMVDATRNTGSVIRTGRSDIRRVSQYYELTNQGKSLEEAASSLGLTASALEQLTAHHTNTNKLASLDAPTAAEGLEIGDMVPDGSQDVEWEAIGPDMAANDVRHLVAQLPEREAKIVSQYFGLPPYAQSCMLAEIAEELGVSESRISRIVNHSVKRMHGMLPSGMLYRRYSSVRGAEDVG